MRRAAVLALAAPALLLFAADAAGQAPDPASDTTELSRTDNTQAVEAGELRLILSKRKREEHALIRRLIFITASLRLTQPAASAGTGPAPQTCHWEYKSYLQRQQCFVSVSGVLACAEAEVTPLPEEIHGEAPAPENAPAGFCNDMFGPAANARTRLAALLHERAAALFLDDQKTKVEPLFKAAGVTVRPDRAAAPASRTSPSAR